MIICRVSGTFNELLVDHKGLKMVLHESSLRDPKCNIIGSYVDKNGWPHMICRDSIFGTDLTNMFQDSRKWNPKGWTARDLLGGL